jgi:hypothetical protein
MLDQLFLKAMVAKLPHATARVCGNSLQYVLSFSHAASKDW